jgi:SAM-dependent methyltransferase
MYTLCGQVMKARLAGMKRSGDASRLSVPAAVEWHAILWAAAHGVRWFDSGGIRRSTADLLTSGRSVGPLEASGPDWFKASFGGRVFVYPPPVEYIGSPLVRLGYDLVQRSGRAEDVLQVIRRQVRGGLRLNRLTGAWRSVVSRSLTRPDPCHTVAVAARSVFEAVLKPPYVVVRRWVTTMLFERRYNVATDGRIPLSVLGIDDEHRGDYLPSGWLSLRRVLPRRMVRPEDVFIDIGSGKGRAVLAAATYPFRQVIGVELSRELHEAACANLERSRDRLTCKNVELVCADALEYEIPDDVSVVFLYNPFTGHIFQRVLDKLIASVDRNPRTLRVVYANPVEEEALLATGRARLVKTASGLRPTKAWARSNAVRLYSIMPREPSVPAGPR